MAREALNVQLFADDVVVNPITSPTGPPSRVAAVLQGRWPDFPETVHRNTRHVFFLEIVRMREEHPTLSAITPFERFQTHFVNAGYFATTGLVRRAWAIAFGVLHSTNFASIWEKPLEELLEAAPRFVSLHRDDLIHF